MGSQIVSSESDISHPILVYRSRNNNSQAQVRRFPALTPPEPEFSVIFGSKWDPLTSAWRQGAPAPKDSLNFRRASLLSRNEFESGTFTIVLHATSSFTYVSVIYGANFPFNLFPAGTRKSLSIPLKFFPLTTVGKEEVRTKFELNLIKTFRNTAMFPGGNVGGWRTKYIQKKSMYKEF